MATDKGTVHQGPQPGVGRRFEIEQRVFLGQVEGRGMRLRRRQADLLARCDMQDVAAETLVAEQGADIL
jgi:hypothetical protein